MSAISYPDFPCGGIHIIDNEIVPKMRPCSLTELVVSLLFKKLSLGYQSHNGLYALWHAMTFDPDKTVENIARNVTEYILICCKLAHEIKSYFWLGFALQIIMDS